MLRAQQPVDAVAQHGALADKETPLTQHLLAFASRAGWNVNGADQTRAQQQSEYLGIHFVRLDLSLRNDPRFERVGQGNALVREDFFEHLKQPMPVH